jgi:hypothetical protein
MRQQRQVEGWVISGGSSRCRLSWSPFHTRMVAGLGAALNPGRTSDHHRQLGDRRGDQSADPWHDLDRSRVDHQLRDRRDDAVEVRCSRVSEPGDPRGLAESPIRSCTTRSFSPTPWSWSTATGSVPPAFHLRPGGLRRKPARAADPRSAVRRRGPQTDDRGHLRARRRLLMISVWPFGADELNATTPPSSGS